jgi:hypothetical protein
MTDAIAARMRAKLCTLIEQGTAAMAGTGFGGMIKPFLPMILPTIERMPDETALGLLSHIEETIRYVRTGDTDGEHAVRLPTAHHSPSHR